MLSDKTRDSWFSYFTRIGFVELHKKLMEDLQRQYDDTMHQLFVEETRDARNEELILKLKKAHRENAMMLSEFSLGTPIIAGVKAKLDKANQGIEFHFERSK